MIVISFGVRKSGSTLACEMAKAVLELNGHPQVLLPDELLSPGRSREPTGRVNFAGPWRDDLVARLIEAAQGQKIVVRTHAHPYKLTRARIADAMDAGEVKIHVVFRDLRGVVLSMLDEARAEPTHSKARTVDEVIARLRPRLEKLRSWGSLPSVKLLYDDFAFDREHGPALIARDLGMTVDGEAVWDLVSGRFTRKNVARPERHTTEMAPADAARIEAAFPDYLEMVEQRDFRWFDAAPA